MKSLIQSVTFDEYYFWTSALGDAYTQGINVEFTSKMVFTNTYFPLHQKYNLRKYLENAQLAGSIKGYMNGSLDGKLGYIIF